jgi:hypothetical protein
LDLHTVNVNRNRRTTSVLIISPTLGLTGTVGWKRLFAIVM